MQIPNIPSDTIYKFSTVLGVVLIVFTITYLFSNLEGRSLMAKNEMKEEVERYVDLAYMYGEIKHLEKELDTLIFKERLTVLKIQFRGNGYVPKFLESDLNPNMIYLYNLKNIESYIDPELLAKVDSLNSLKKRFDKYFLINETSEPFRKIQVFNKKLLQITAWLSIGIGFILTIWGFTTWNRVEKKKMKEIKIFAKDSAKK